jgi:glycine cleavage system aminomethyltransferase T
VIVRVTHRGGGRVARKLVGLRLMSGDLPKAGNEIQAAGRVIGRITSAVRSPALAANIAMGYVHRDFVEPGVQIEVSGGSGPVTAEVSPLPFIPLALRLQLPGP